MGMWEAILELEWEFDGECDWIELMKTLDELVVS